jgi:hypothetical protein
MDKPQNLLEPPISNYQNNVIKVNEGNNDLNNNLKSSADSSQCTNLISNNGCDIDGNNKPTNTAIVVDKPIIDDKPAATPLTDDKPAATPLTDDKLTATPVTDDNPAAANNEVGNSTSGNDQDEKNALDFLAPVY